MKIALDWDGTVTRDVGFWEVFVLMCKNHGHDVRIVTLRHERQIDDDMRKFGIPIICTSNKQKRDHLREIEWFADIFIDDSPEFIVDLDFHKYVLTFKD
jgi:hypothetical protein